jgi:RecA/RadA recombinase
MRRTINSPQSLSDQLHEHANGEPSFEKVLNFSRVISTGSTLLDLAISGGVVRGGGLPGGILVEAFGPAGCGKTVLLCEIARHIQKLNGAVKFFDPEARLNLRFASLLGLDVSKIEYERPNTVLEVFKPIRKWGPPKGMINGIIADSLAALSTEMEMEDQDKMGMRRAKDFSEQLRKTCRILSNENYLMVCSNQIRQNMDAGPYGQKWKTPGGEAFPFYSSVRLRFHNPEKIRRKKTIAGKEQIRVIGIDSQIEVVKNSVWESFHIVPVTILFNYGVDDIRQNLQFIKDVKGEKFYSVAGDKLSNSLEDSIAIVEDEKLWKRLRNETIDVWSEVEEKFKQTRRPKQ